MSKGWGTDMGVELTGLAVQIHGGMGFIEETGAFGLLEKRLHQTNMKDFLAENPDLYPKGLNVESEYTVVVRRSKES